MACFDPLPAYVSREGGQPRIGRRPGEEGDKLELPCGRCVGCRKDQARAWSIRCSHEAQLYDSNLFLTLDYAPEHLRSPSLRYEDFQGFMKRLRKRVRGVSPGPDGSYPVRFFVAGEYGERFKRPHYHALLFNCDFSDKVQYVNDTFRSELAENLWGRGNVVIGAVTPESAAYCAGYTIAKVGKTPEDYEDICDPNTGLVDSRRPEFCQMSRRPGIGASWYDRYRNDLFSGDFAVSQGRKYKVPRYYWQRFRESGEANEIERVTEERYKRSKAVDPVENTERRRLEKLYVAKARLALFCERSH